MKISIIVPAYNIEAPLPRCLDSLLAQEYSDLEIIVVNDGSKDGTAAVMDAYAAKDSRIKAIHKENGGVTSARLRGLAEATGDWIGFCDGDDFVEPDMYARLMANALEHNAVISHCGYKMMFPSGKIDYYYNTGKLVVQSGKQGCTDLLEGHFVEPALWNKIYHRSLFAGLTDWLDASIRINEDLLMNFYLFRQADVAVFEDFCPYHYILRKGSAAVSKLNEHKLADPIKVQHIMDTETANEPAWNYFVQARLTYILIGTATLAYGDQKGLIKPHRKAARKELRQRLGGILKGKFSKGLKLMALWAAYLPTSYRWVHNLYARMKGTYKRFEIN